MEHFFVELFDGVERIYSVLKTGLESSSDEAVEQALVDAARAERKCVVRVLRCLIEFGERRKLHRRRSFPSLFEYCTSRLGYGEGAAYKRIRAAKASVLRPRVLDLLEQGRTDLSRVVVISAHLGSEHAETLLEKVCSLKKRDLEFLVAGLAPKQIPKDNVRLLEFGVVQTQSPAKPAEAPIPPAVTPTAPAAPAMPEPQNRVEALNQDLARISLTIDRQALEEFDRACKLLHTRRSDGGRVFARAIRALLKEIDPEVRLANKRKVASRPSDSRKRRIPQAVRDAVWKRDGGQCAFRDANGVRCSARAGLQFDHVRPWAAGGSSCDPDNVRLLCPLHNQAEARRWFSDAYVDRAIAIGRRRVAAGRAAPG